jgi:hypothetical protein
MNTQDNIRMESHKDPAQLEHEIDQQRHHIEQIMSALENKLSPGEMFDRMLNLGKGGGREFAGNLAQTVKANPVPALLTAAGLMWLYSSSRNNTMGGAMASGYGTTTTGTTASASHADASTGMHGSSGGMREKLGSARSRVSESAHHVAGSVRERAHGAAETARRGADTARRGVTRANDGFRHMLDENPMAAGAIGIAVGALLGSMIPTTRKEDELMGETRERITGKARDLAREGRDTLANAGRKMAGANASGGSAAQDSSTGAAGSTTSTSSVTTDTATQQRPH